MIPICLPCFAEYKQYAIKMEHRFDSESLNVKDGVQDGDHFKVKFHLNSQSKLITKTIFVVFGEFDWHVVVFHRYKIFNEQDGSKNSVWNHIGFVMIHFTENITDSYFFVMVMFCILSLFW